MSRVVYDMSMSLDGFVTAAGISPEEPLDAGGQRLHEWGYPGTDPRGISLVEQNVQSEGAIIVGRRTYDTSRQLIQARHLDERRIHIVPVWFGDGIRVYEQVGGEHVQLDLVEAIPTPDATHLHYRVRT